jgi:glucosamine--fructose-6-phosphate aminotransferase (isomerizing)
LFQREGVAMTLRKEILEQPQVLRRLLDEGEPRAHEIAHAIQARDVDYIFLTARGTSDNAGLYAKYLWGAMNRLPIALAAPSLFSIYHQPPRLDNALVVGISQSGQSPDIVNVVREGRRQGAPTLAIVNKPESPLAESSEFVLDVRAGEEQAVAATKSYTAQLMAIAMLAAALADDAEAMEALHGVPDLVEQALALEPDIERAAERYRYMTQCIVLGRGYNYATAYEWSLKLKELTYVLAEPYSSADFRHGPIAVVERGFPVLAVTPAGAVHEDLLGLLQRLAEERRAELVVVSNEPQSLALAQTPLPLPALLEWVSPLVSIVPGQLFCYYLTRAKAYDTEQPRGLQKVTRTR